MMLNNISTKKLVTIILLITALAYGNTLVNQFVMDDYKFIVESFLIQDFRNFAAFFGPHNQPEGEGGVYSPLKIFFHALTYRFFNDNPVGYHLVAILIHLLSTYFVFRISLLLLTEQKAAGLAALLFGLHPVHVEAITFMTASIDTLGILFLFISFYQYLLARQSERREDEYDCRRQDRMALVFAVLAIFTHELAASLPFLFLWYEFCYNPDRPRLPRATLRRLGYFFLILAFYVALKFLILGNVSRTGYLGGSFYLTMLTMVKAGAKYIMILLAPVTLAVKPILSPGIFAVDMDDFDPAAVSAQALSDVQVWSGLVLLLTVFGIGCVFYRRRPIITFALGWLFVSLLPAANIIPSGCFFAERYLYPGSWGYCLLLAYLLQQAWQRKDDVVVFRRVRLSQRQRFIAVAVVVGIISGFYFVRTWLRNRDWRNEFVFIQAEVRTNPESADLKSILAMNYLYQNQVPKAVEIFQQCIDTRPDDPHFYFQIAEAYLTAEQLSYAHESLRRAIALDPDFAEAYYNLAVVYRLQGQRQESKNFLLKAISVYNKQGREKEGKAAREYFKEYFGRI